MKNSSYKFKDNTHNFGQGAELSGSKKEKEGDMNERYKIGNATVRIHGKVDPDKLKEATVEFLKGAEKQKKSKKLVEKGA